MRKKSADSEQKHRHTLRQDFWEQALEAFSQSNCSVYNNISPTKDHWLSAGSGLSGMPYQLIFGKKTKYGSVLACKNSQAAANSFVFERLAAKRDGIEAAFGHSLVWLPMPNKKPVVSSTPKTLMDTTDRTGLR